MRIPTLAIPLCVAATAIAAEQAKLNIQAREVYGFGYTDPSDPSGTATLPASTGVYTVIDGTTYYSLPTATGPVPTGESAASSAIVSINPATVAWTMITLLGVAAGAFVL